MEKYKADMGEEIEPQIAELISRAEKGTKTLQKKHQALQTKVCVCARARYSSCTTGLSRFLRNAWVCAGCNGSFEATITPSARWDESSLANAHEAERTTGGAASRIRVRNFDDGELAELRVICSSVYKTISLI